MPFARRGLIAVTLRSMLFNHTEGHCVRPNSPASLRWSGDHARDVPFCGGVVIMRASPSFAVIALVVAIHCELGFRRDADERIEQ